MYPTGTGTPSMGPGQTRVTGNPWHAAVAAVDYHDDYESVFGMSLAELTGLAHMVVTDPLDFPSPIPTNALVIVDVGSTLTLGSSNPLLGTGIVVVRGNLTFNQGNNSNFSGLLYVEGNFTMRDPSEISGSVICTGNVSIQGAHDFSTIRFDPEVIDSLMGSFGNYQRSKPLHLPRKDK